MAGPTGSAIVVSARRCSTPGKTDLWAPRLAIMKQSKVAIVGAGSVGASIAYSVLIQRLARVVALYDVNDQKVEAETLDLSHGTQFTGATQVIGGSDPQIVADAQVVVITAGAKQHPGQSRLDLAATNVAILEKMLPQLLEYAPDAVYVLVTNPCDVLTVAAQQISGLPPQRVFASGTVLDTSRLRRLIANRSRIAAMSIHANIIGEHGDTSFPVWSQARIGPIPILEWTGPDGDRIEPSELDAMATEVREAAYRIIEGKGATNYAIGLAASRIIEAIVSDQHAIMPVSTIQDGFEGLHGVALAVPTVVGAGGALQVVPLHLDAHEHQLLERSADALRSAQRALGL